MFGTCWAYLMSQTVSLIALVIIARFDSGPDATEAMKWPGWMPIFSEWKEYLNMAIPGVASMM